MNKLVKTILRYFRITVTPQYLRKHGAVVGEDVELYNVKCSKADATCLKIGNHVTLTGVHILTHDASLKRYVGNGCNRIGRVVIGNNVFIGINTILLPNTYIGNNVVIGAGSVITGIIPDNSVAAGNPAKVICSCDEFVQKHTERMKDNNLIYYVDRTKMTAEEITKFNQEIDGKIVYAIKKHTNKN